MFCPPRSLKRFNSIKYCAGVAAPRISLADPAASCFAEPAAQPFVALQPSYRLGKLMYVAGLYQDARLSIDHGLGNLTQSACYYRPSHRHILKDFGRRAEKLGAILCSHLR